MLVTTRGYLIKLLAWLIIVLSPLLVACVDSLDLTEVARPAFSTATAVPTLTPQPEITVSLDKRTPYPLTSEVYQSEQFDGMAFLTIDESNARVEEWERRRPDSPGILLVAKASAIGILAASRLTFDDRSGSDKWLHCMIGAEMALATSLDAAAYAAWFKEYQDLTDGDPNTAFDEEDYRATMYGARQATEVESCEDCSEVCEARWGDRTDR